MSKSVICINNNSNPASLIVGKVYRILPDAATEAYNLCFASLMRASQRLMVISTQLKYLHLLTCQKWRSMR